MSTITLELKPVPKSLLTGDSITSLITLSLSLASTVPDISTLPTTADTAGPSSATAPTPSWSQHSNKTYPLAEGKEHTTKLYKATVWGEPWLARTTTTAAVAYGDVKKGLFEAKIDTERETVIQAGDENNIVDERQVEGFRVQDIQKLLHIQAFSARSFLQTLIYHEFPVAPGAKRAFIVISVPTEGEAVNVRGMYACAEIVQETEEGVELICLLTSDAGGSIPRWVQNMAMPNQLISDNNLFFQYVFDHKA